MSTEDTAPPVTAFMLIKTMPEWLAMTPEERVNALETQVMPAVKARTSGVRSRFYDTEFYSTRVTDVWVWEADDHDAYQLLIDALRETPFWDRYFEVVDLLVGTENGYARTYGTAPVATIST
ncbi:darcynin family protein [Streptomyces smyrnaeus]|uniref:darcynin family protein n=1 Tax=Streptomyces TaxID=1883 RepID=UPI00161E6CD3|nr:darcynin family protein [Streptomyces sp. B15]MBQ1119888.1 darcynin [Streptomyces sp. B15]MBQ1160832.1 darcynin [Streptomyces sp. A73]